MDRVAPDFSLVPRKSELTFFSVTSLSHVMRAVYRPSSEYTLCECYFIKLIKKIILGPEECNYSSNDVLLAIIGVLAFTILLLIIYIIWLHKKGR